MAGLSRFVPARCRGRTRQHRAGARDCQGGGDRPDHRSGLRALTREQEITLLIAQGAATAESAGRLYLSAHTVRDYIKTIFDKVGVCSRGELVARLFAEHYAPIHFDPANLDHVTRGSAEWPTSQVGDRRPRIRVS